MSKHTNDYDNEDPEYDSDSEEEGEGPEFEEGQPPHPPPFPPGFGPGFFPPGPPPHHGKMHGHRHGPHGHPPPPPFGFRPRYPPFGRFGFDFPIRKGRLNEFRYFFALNLINEFPEGINVYQLQEKYKFPRGNIVRLVEELEAQKYIESKEITEKGRTQKSYSLTETGRDYLAQLKRRWSEFFSQMSDHAPLEDLHNPFIHEEERENLLDELKQCKSREDAIDFIRGMRSDINRQRNHIEERMKKINSFRSKIDDLLAFVEKQDSFDVKKVKEYLEKKE